MPGRRRNSRGEGSLLREDIVTAGLDLLRASRSESAVTVRAVARRTGMAPQSFYLHFASPHELLFELYKRQYTVLIDGIRRRVAESPPESGRALRAACEAYLAFARDRPAEYGLLFETRGEAQGWSDARPGDELVQEFRILLEQRSSVGVDVALALLWASLHGLASLMRDRPAYPWPEVDALLDRLLTLLCSTDGGH